MIGGSRVSGAELVGESGKLRVIARNGVGYDAVDTQALSGHGILLTNTPVAVRTPVATTAVAFILALSLRLPVKSRLAREGRWSERADHPGVGLPGRTLGIVGLGGIGRELVRLMQPYGMTILAADPHVDKGAAAQAGAKLTELDDLLKVSDFVVVACLLNESTRRLLNADRLRLMKPSAYLINVARGPIIDESALIEILAQGRIAGAALDVFERATRPFQSSAHDGQCHFHRPLPVLDGYVRGSGRPRRDLRHHRCYERTAAFVRGQSGSESPPPRSGLASV
jgi:phosphoglycerate dehydrogenase-like enzyme